MTKKIIVLIVSVFSLLIGGTAFIYSGVDSKATEYSYENAKEDLKVIAKEPHSTKYHKEALARVRDYIVNELEKLEMKPEIFHYSDIMNDKGDITDLDNIYAKIDGQNGENGSYILLMAHYDSAGSNPQNDDGYSFGAADDGYGVATILEVLRMIKNSDRTPVNGIKVLITDGEEMHLIGSREEFDKNFSLYENVGLAVNLEARGTSGPVIIFQTIDNNSRMLKLYEEGNYPVASSLITDFYKESGRSDMLSLIDKDIPGINLTVLDNVEYYHTPDDAYANISDKSMQHYGDQLLPIVEKFIYSEEYSDTNYLKSGDNMVFFTLLPNVLVKYSTTLSTVLSVLAIAVVIFFLIMNRKNFREILLVAGRNLIFLLAAAVSGFGISYGLSAITGHHFTLSHMGKVPGDDILVIILPVLLLGLYAWLTVRRKSSPENRLLSGLLLQTVLLIVVVIFSPGAGYLVMFPVIITLSALLFHKTGKKKVYECLLLLDAAVIIILYVPLMYLLVMAFSIAALPFLFAIVISAGILVVPCVKAYMI